MFIYQVIKKSFDWSHSWKKYFKKANRYKNEQPTKGWPKTQSSFSTATVVVVVGKDETQENGFGT